jgi:Cellulase (glycosyl hydrolase family 5)
MTAYTSHYNVSTTEWYTSKDVQKQCRAYFKAAINRYTTSKAIFAWELANEPGCHGCPTSMITEWAKFTSEFIKRHDPDHMVTLGDESWLNGGDDGSYSYATAEGIDDRFHGEPQNPNPRLRHLPPLSFKLGRARLIWQLLDNRPCRGVQSCEQAMCWNYKFLVLPDVGHGRQACGYNNRLCGLLPHYTIERFLGPCDGEKILVKGFSS